MDNRTQFHRSLFYPFTLRYLCAGICPNYIYLKVISMKTLELISNAVGSNAIAQRALVASHLYTFKDFDLCVKLLPVLHLVHRDTRRTVTAYLADILSFERSYVALTNNVREKARIVVNAVHRAAECGQDTRKLQAELMDLLTPKTNKGNTMKNINQQAMALAHSIKAAYSSFRTALLVAYKVIKGDYKTRWTILDGLDKAGRAFAKLKQPVKCAILFNAWVAIWNLDYLD